MKSVSIFATNVLITRLFTAQATAPSASFQPTSEGRGNETRIPVSGLEDMIVSVTREHTEYVRRVMAQNTQSLMKEIEMRSDDVSNEVLKVKAVATSVQSKVQQIYDLLESLIKQGPMQSNLPGMSSATGTASAFLGNQQGGNANQQGNPIDPASSAQAWRILNSIPTRCNRCHFCASGKKCPSNLIAALLLDINEDLPYTRLASLVPNSPSHYLLTEIFNQIGTPICKSNCNVCFTIANNDSIKKFLADLAPRILHSAGISQMPFLGQYYGSQAFPQGQFVNPASQFMNPGQFANPGQFVNPSTQFMNPGQFNYPGVNPLLGGDLSQSRLMEMLAVHNYARKGESSSCKPEPVKTGSGYTTLHKKDETKRTCLSGETYDESCS